MNDIFLQSINLTSLTIVRIILNPMLPIIAYAKIIEVDYCIVFFWNVNISETAIVIINGNWQINAIMFWKPINSKPYAT
jgi:hypothetical protein